MANKNINVLLNLKDKFTQPLNKTTQATKKAERQIKSAHSVINKFASNANEKFKKIAATAAKTIGAISVATLAAGIKTGFSEAFDLETYKAQLETATGSTEKAAQLMKYAINMANKTPFEGGELVEAASKFEAMGMSAEEWLTRAGDMAGATGKDINQAVEAIIDAQSGEWERMKEFGIKGVDNMDDLVAIMNDRFSGGMAKLAGITKGMWSTVTGVTKNSLANIVGIMNDGTIKAGSPLDLLRQKIQKIADKLVQWQNDGTIDKLSAKISDGLGKAMDFLGKAISFVKDNADWLLPVLAGVVSAFTAFNVITKVVTMFKTLKTVITGVKAAGSLLNFVLAANPLGLIAVIIGVVVAAGILLYKNWDTIKAKATELWSKVKEVFGSIRDSIVGAFDSVKETVSVVFDWIGNKISGIGDKISNIPVIGDAVKWVREKTSTSGHATGSAYFRGGLTRINEGGRGEVVNLPNGTQIIPHNASKNTAGTSNNITLNVTVQGNVIGNEAYTNYLGNVITKRVVLAINNM